jgi:hypothetical protein
LQLAVPQSPRGNGESVASQFAESDAMTMVWFNSYTVIYLVDPLRCIAGLDPQ